MNSVNIDPLPVKPRQESPLGPSRGLASLFVWCRRTNIAQIQCPTLPLILIQKHSSDAAGRPRIIAANYTTAKTLSSRVAPQDGDRCYVMVARQ